EISTLSSLSHPNVVKFVDSHACLSCSFIVMEYCNGGSLEQVLKFHAAQNMILDESLLWHLFEGLVAAIGHCHSGPSYSKGWCPIIYSDLKPSNVLLSTTPGMSYPTVK
ncbi:kinase-like protein, partial [Massarina eburnea CBS 473.64]